MKKADDLEAFKAAVQDIWNKYSAAMNAEDSDLWISLWDENGIQMPPGTSARGKQVFEEAIRKVIEGAIFNMTIYPEEITVAGDWGYSRGTYKDCRTPKAGGETVYIDGKFLTILKRQPDGSWKIFRDCFNSNVPPG